MDVSLSPNITSSSELILQPRLELPGEIMQQLPATIASEGRRAAFYFVEFFTANIRNPNTRRAYARAVSDFMRWCEARQLTLQRISSIDVAIYIETQVGSPQTVNQCLAAIRMLFDHLVVRQVMSTNPAASVRGRKYVAKKGKTPALSAEDTRHLLNSIDTSTVVGLRDRALIATMFFTFARVGAVVRMNVGDYYRNGKRSWIRLHEKGGRLHEVPAHQTVKAYLDEYIAAANIGADRKSSLFRTALGRTGYLTTNKIRENDVLRMVKRRAAGAGLPISTCCHTFRTTGITNYLSNGGTIEGAQYLAAHESPRTTKLYDRTNRQITIEDVERISI